MVRLTLLPGAARRPNTAYTSMHIWVPLWAHTQAREYPRNTVTHTEGPTFVSSHALMLRQARGDVCSSRLFPLNEAF